MRVTVKLFAILRERAGVSEATLDVRDGATISALRELLAEQFPVLRDVLRQTAFAVNREYASNGTALADGDEVAAIPPVSGG